MPNLSYTESPNIYPAGLLYAYVDVPPEGIAEKITAAHHVEILERQLLCYRGYPLEQANTCGELATVAQYGLFQAPPNAESVKIHITVYAGDVITDRVFSVAYNSQTKTVSLKGEHFNPGYLRYHLGPWNLASPGGDTVSDLIFSLSSTVRTEIYALSAEFSKKTA